MHDTIDYGDSLRNAFIRRQQSINVLICWFLSVFHWTPPTTRSCSQYLDLSKASMDVHYFAYTLLPNSKSAYFKEVWQPMLSFLLRNSLSEGKPFRWARQSFYYSRSNFASFWTGGMRSDYASEWTSFDTIVGSRLPLSRCFHIWFHSILWASVLSVVLPRFTLFRNVISEGSIFLSKEPR